MTAIPRAVLSEQFQELLRGRRILAGVFLTYQFEPDFFEQEVLPALVDLPFSNVPKVRLLQLEDALRSEVGQLAVYYDRGALVSLGESSKLDIRRIPISIATGYFHPKNILLLTEAAHPGEDGNRGRSLLIATMSANLTTAGWWDNVEACHIETVADGDSCGFRDDILDLIRRVKRCTPAGESHDALEMVRSSVQKLTQRRQSTSDGVLHTRLYTGGTSVADFLGETRGDELRGKCLEVISPFFDETDAKPLRDLHERFAPRETRVLLPRAEDGSALCGEDYYDAVRSLAYASWGQLPSEVISRGQSKGAKPRRVHAKVYRFFDPNRRYEAIFVGSVNLTHAAHSRGGNFETAFFVETNPSRLSDWWLGTDKKKPGAFLGSEVEELTNPTTSLSIKYDWHFNVAQAYWDQATQSSTLGMSAQGTQLFVLTSLPPREWIRLTKDQAAKLEQTLASTAFLMVSENGDSPVTILVQEDGMAHKPSIVSSLTVAEILRYWALLTPEQRAAFLEERMELLVQAGIDLPPNLAGTLNRDESLFDKFAGAYHAFESLKTHVLRALGAGRENEAEYRLFGRKYDSLPSLLERALADKESMDPAFQYVLVLCAKQLVREVSDTEPAFRAGHRRDFKNLERMIDKGMTVRDRFSFGTAEERVAFLEWFDKWFLERAKPMATAT